MHHSEQGQFTAGCSRACLVELWMSPTRKIPILLWTTSWTTIFDHYHGEKVFLNVQLEFLFSPLLSVSIACCPFTVHLCGGLTWAGWTGPHASGSSGSCRQQWDPPLLSLLHPDHTQLSQPLLACHVLQPPTSLVVSAGLAPIRPCLSRTVETQTRRNTADMASPSPNRGGKSLPVASDPHCPSCTLASGGLLCCKGTLLTPAFHQDIQVLFCKAAFWPQGTQPAVLHCVYPGPDAGSALGYVELHYNCQLISPLKSTDFSPSRTLKLMPCRSSDSPRYVLPVLKAPVYLFWTDLSPPTYLL